MVSLGLPLGKNYFWELNLLYKFRPFREGLSTGFLIELDLFKDDHNPSFRVEMVLFNFVIFHFTIYNIHHVNEE